MPKSIIFLLLFVVFCFGYSVSYLFFPRSADQYLIYDRANVRWLFYLMNIVLLLLDGGIIFYIFKPKKIGLIFSWMWFVLYLIEDVFLVVAYFMNQDLYHNMIVKWYGGKGELAVNFFESAAGVGVMICSMAVVYIILGLILVLRKNYFGQKLDFSCGDCGGQLVLGSKFCHQCGREIIPNQNNELMDNFYHPKKLMIIKCANCGYSAPPKWWILRLILGILYIIPLGLIILFYFFYSNPYICGKCHRRDKLIKIYNNRTEKPISCWSKKAFLLVWLPITLAPLILSMIGFWASTRYIGQEATSNIEPVLNWREYNNGSFKVMFPGEPTINKNSVTVEDVGQAMYREYWRNNSSGQVTYWVESWRFTNKSFYNNFTGKNNSEKLRNLFNNFYVSENNEILKTEIVSFAGVEALQFEVLTSKENIKTIGRLFFTNASLYLLSIPYNLAKEQRVEADKFFDSFMIIEMPEKFETTIEDEGSNWSVPNSEVS